MIGRVEKAHQVVGQDMLQEEMEGVAVILMAQVT